MVMKHIKFDTMNKYACQALVCLMCIFSIATYANPSPTVELNGQLRASLEFFIQKNHLAGAVLSYKLPAKNPVTLAVGYQNVEKKIPMSYQSYFAIGSATKVFLSSQIMQQVALGKKISEEEKKYATKEIQLKLIELISQLEFSRLKVEVQLENMVLDESGHAEETERLLREWPL